MSKMLQKIFFAISRSVLTEISCHLLVICFRAWATYRFILFSFEHPLKWKMLSHTNFLDFVMRMSKIFLICFRNFKISETAPWHSHHFFVILTLHEQNIALNICLISTSSELKNCMACSFSRFLLPYENLFAANVWIIWTLVRQLNHITIDLCMIF